MQVILLEDLEGLGARGATVNVKPGYARNYLLPRKLAIASGTRSANLYQELARQKEQQREQLIAEARTEAAKLEGLEINLPAQANEEDTLFGSITVNLNLPLPARSYSLSRSVRSRTKASSCGKPVFT